MILGGKEVPDGNNAFDRLAERMGAPGSKRFARILEAMMSSEEAAILLEAPVWKTAKEIAQKLNIDEKSLQPRLDDMELRQIIRKSDMGYIAPGNIVAFHHGAIGWMREDLKAKVYPLWGDFFFAEWRDILVDGFISRKEKGAPGAHRVVPAYKALRLSPKVKPEQILWYEDMEQVLRRSERISLMMCGCRGLWRKCDSPVDVCVQVEYKTGSIRPKRKENEFIKPPKDVTFEEAMKVIDDCEDRGMVHIPLNTSHGDLFCNCCDDCCMVINPLLHRGEGKIWEILTPSRYRAVVDQELCTGCQTCVDRCKFDAIEMRQVPGSKKLKSSIINEHCLGCGACVVKCPNKALTLELVRPPEHIPTVTPLELFKMGQKT
jgi:ferredoxin